MGIPNLLQNYKINRNVSIQTLKQQKRRFIIDGHCILHKVGFANANQLVLNKDLTGVIMGLARHIVDFLQNSSQVILVFDGQCLPNKMETISKRRQQRENAFEKLQTTLDREERYKLIKQCVSFSMQDVFFIANVVTWMFNMLLETEIKIDLSAYNQTKINKVINTVTSSNSNKVDLEFFNQTLIQQLQQGQQISYNNIIYNLPDLLFKLRKYIPNKPKCNFFTCIAPYEADAQIIYLCKAGYADIIVTIDSDLTIYGAADVYLQYDIAKSCGDLVTKENVFEETFKEFQNIENRFYLLRKVAILSGCDYVKSLVGIGLKKAYQALMEEKCIINAVNYLLSKFNIKNPYETINQYQFNILQALFTFEYQVIYNPKAMACYNLHQIISDDIQLYEIFEEKATGCMLNKRDAILFCQPGILKYQRVDKLKTYNENIRSNIVISVEENMDLMQLQKGIIIINAQTIGTGKAPSPDRRSPQTYSPVKQFKSYLNAKYRE